MQIAKQIKAKSRWGAMALALLGLACSRQELENFRFEQSDPSVVSSNNTPLGIRKEGEHIHVPLKIDLSHPAGKSFQVELQLIPDTIAQLVANGTLENTVGIPVDQITAPNAVTVPFGADSSTFTVSVNLGFAERQFGRNIAFAYRLLNPSKHNELDPANNSGVVVLNTAEILDPAEIRYLSITNGGGGMLTLTQGQNYTVTSAGVTIPLGISLNGVPGPAFTVRTRVNNDAVATLAENGILPANTATLAIDEYTLDTLVHVTSNTTSKELSLSIPWAVMDRHISSPIGMVVELRNPSRHVLHPSDHVVVIQIDPSVNLDNNSYLEGNGVGLKAEYFEGQFLDSDGRAPGLVRLDEQINFVGWQPLPVGDNWSSRWTGEFFAPVTGEYTFYQTRWDDGSRLKIDGEWIIDDFTTEWDKPSRFGTIHLERGQRYPIEAHHRENVGGQQAVLEFEVRSAGVDRRVVPKSLLYPPADFNP
ncbi:PA14 domain-containing protein [Parapedobacter deserti]|uniref:PA14 domain-containing protein n=1 Tax=Parapedobacter deserti TaxID=1912957 RepID=A0ABV7JII4_9SPHI